MDAAAFPTSVGVNPSATIAAVAEYKIEQFIRGERKRKPRRGERATMKRLSKWIKTMAPQPSTR